MVDRTQNEHGHWGSWELDPGHESYNVSLWVDQGVLMLRAVDRKHGDPVELNAHEALDVALALLERVREIEKDEGGEGNEASWRRIACLAS